MAAAVLAVRKRHRRKIQHVDSALLDPCVHLLPPEDEWELHGFLDKLIVGTDGEEWKPRQCVLSRGRLLLVRVNENVVVDQIPVEEIVHAVPVAAQPSHPRSNESHAKAHSKAHGHGHKHWPRTNGSVELVDDSECEERNRETHFEVKTSDDGFNAGRTYVLRAESKKERDEWLRQLSDRMERVDEQADCLWRTKQFVKVKYDSKEVQTFVAIMILGNFACSIMAAQIHPEEGTGLFHLFEGVDYFFTIFFAVEVSVNMIANWFHAFFRGEGAGWNIFDLVVVIVSLLTIPLDHLPGLSHLRLMRVLRVVRLFERLQSLRKIVAALTSAIIPVANAFIVLSVVTGIYAVVGVSMFRVRDPVNFGSFTNSIFTMFQVMTGDGWASTIARPLFHEDKPTFSISIFFISYILIAGTFLFNVVIAVLLDEFITAVAKEKERTVRKADDEALDEVMRKGCALDPLLLYLSECRTQKELTERIRTVYKVVDSDDSGGLSFDELKRGLRKLRLKPPIHFAEEDFDVVTEQGALCNADGELDVKAFERIIRLQLRMFMDKQLAIRMRNADGDLHQANVLHTLRHILMVLDDGLAVTNETLAGGDRSLLQSLGPTRVMSAGSGGGGGGSLSSSASPIALRAHTAPYTTIPNRAGSNGTNGLGVVHFEEAPAPMSPLRSTGASWLLRPHTSPETPPDLGSGMEERLAGRLTAIEESLQTLLQRTSPPPPPSPSEASPAPSLSRSSPLSQPPRAPLHFSARTPTIQLSSRSLLPPLPDPPCPRPQTDAPPPTLPRPDPTPQAVLALASPRASSPVPDASWSDEAAADAGQPRTNTDPSNLRPKAISPRGKPGGAGSSVKLSAGGGGGGKQAAGARRRRPQHQQRLRIVAGGDKQERAERAGERSREGEKQMGGRWGGMERQQGEKQGEKQGDDTPQRAWASENLAADARHEGGGGGGLGRQEQRGENKDEEGGLGLWPTRVWGREEMGQEQLCKGCAKCWGGYVGVGCMVSGQNTAMVTELRPWEQQAHVRANGEHSRLRGADGGGAAWETELAEAADALLTQSVGEGGRVWFDKARFVDTLTGDGRHLLRCYIKTEEGNMTEVARAGGGGAREWPISWMQRADASSGRSRACFGNF